MLDRARQRHSALANLLLPVFEEELRQADIMTRRKVIEGADHRLFLRFPLNIADRTKLLELIGQRFPDNDAVELIVRWVKELSRIKTLASPAPNVLGISDIDDNYLKVLASLLKDDVFPTGEVRGSRKRKSQGFSS